MWCRAWATTCCAASAAWRRRSPAARRRRSWSCGGTSPRVFELSPEIFTSRVLMLECTFLKAQEDATRERFKHLDLVDLERVAERFANEAIVLHHLSRRHRVAELKAEVARRLPTVAPRVRFLVEPEWEEAG